MDGHVTARAFATGLEAETAMGYPSLIMEPGMTLQAKLSSFTPHQQHAVGAAVGRVAGSAAFHLRCRMFVDIRAAFFRVAIHTGFPSALTQVRPIRSAMGIVTIRTLHRSFRDAVMCWQGELCLNVTVAGIAEVRLGLA